MKSRLNCYFDPKLADQLTTFALRQGVHRSQLVEAADEGGFATIQRVG